MEEKHAANAMTKQQAAEVLQTFNRWRRGDEPEMPSPKLIGIAIGMAVVALRGRPRKPKSDRYAIPIPETFDPWESVTVSAERHGVCRRTIYKWRKVVAERKEEA